MKPFEHEKLLLPAFPRTLHLPGSRATGGDLLASSTEAEAITTELTNVEEKIDGACVGITLDAQGTLLVRNKDHVLRKGYLKDTAAKRQFRPLWEWCYENMEKFQALTPYSVYGEWLWMQHGMYYTHLPEFFIAFDLYDPESKTFLPPPRSRGLLEGVGFIIPKLFHQGANPPPLAPLLNTISDWAPNTPIEGVYVKTYDQHRVTGRFKLVRQDFTQGELFDPTEVHKNQRA